MAIASIKYKIKAMKTYIRPLLLLFAIILVTTSCKDDFPIDEKGLLITDRAECYISNFDLLGSDHRTVIVGKSIIDTVALTVHAEVMYGTNLKNLKPFCSVVTDATVTPTMGVWSDFSDLSKPKEYTVISGNRKVRKTYTVHLSVQQPTP